jgi:hypothetical protein
MLTSNISLVFRQYAINTSCIHDVNGRREMESSSFSVFVGHCEYPHELQLAAKVSKDFFAVLCDQRRETFLDYLRSLIYSYGTSLIDQRP